MNRIDLHSHTTASDGTFTPSELIEKAHSIGLKVIAVTDHDTTEGLDEALEKAKEYPALEVIQGTELSSLYKNREIHIVGLFVDKDNNEFKAGLESLKEKRMERNVKMINKLQNLGLDLSYDELISVSGGKVITRAHFARLLQEKGYVKNKNEAFDKYIGHGKPGYVKRDVLTAEKEI
ncbi:MAG: PHP domain-containing protein [Eubacterium sp.]|nr:PHP domain-containing protein [Eubacterium sp.]